MTRTRLTQSPLPVTPVGGFCISPRAECWPWNEAHGVQVERGAGCRVASGEGAERCPATLTDPRLRTHSNLSTWDQAGWATQRLRAEGLNDTQIARLLHVTPRTVKRRRARVS